MPSTGRLKVRSTAPHTRRIKAQTVRASLASVRIIMRKVGVW